MFEIYQSNYQSYTAVYQCEINVLSSYPVVNRWQVKRAFNSLPEDYVTRPVHHVGPE